MGSEMRPMRAGVLRESVLHGCALWGRYATGAPVNLVNIKAIVGNYPD